MTPGTLTRTLLVSAVLVAPGCPQPGADLDTTGAPEDTGASETAPTGGATSPDDPTSAPDIMDDTDGPGSTSTGEGIDSDSTTGSTGSTGTGTGTGSDTGEAGVCGDGVLDPGEACDDGNADVADGCLPDCQFAPGAKVTTLPLPTLAGESMSCFTQVPKRFLGDTADALVIGGRLKDFGPNFEAGARVWQVSLPDAAAANWSYAEYADPYERYVYRAVTAANGDVIVAGLIMTEHVQLDSGGYLWLARFAPDGALVWSHEEEDLNVGTIGLAVTPGGEIVVSGHCTGLCSGSSVNVFDAAGELLWKDHALQSKDLITSYRSAVVDAAGQIYVVGVRSTEDYRHLLIRAYQPGGALVWETELDYPLAPYFAPGDLVLTSDNMLVVGVGQYDAQLYETETMGLAAFDTAGAQLWWNEWTASKPGAISPGSLVATDDGGFHMIGALRIDYLTTGAIVARFDADGDELWSNVTVTNDAPRDLLRGADDQLYVLREASIDVHAP